MGFFDRLKRAVRKIKGKLIVSAILILIIIVWAIAPFAVALQDAIAEGPLDWAILLEEIGLGIMKPLTQLNQCIGNQVYRACFFAITKWFILFYALFVAIGIARAIPSHEYEDIENGSSDWCENGEQYKVLSKNKGMVLAEKNYLPVDKRGNVNVLIVRRFWCW